MKLKRLWNCAEVVLVPIVIGALGTISKRFHLYAKKAGLDGSIVRLRGAYLLGTARVIGKMMVIGGHLVPGNDPVEQLGKPCEPTIIIIIIIIIIIWSRTGWI